MAVECYLMSQHEGNPHGECVEPLSIWNTLDTRKKKNSCKVYKDDSIVYKDDSS